MIETAVENGSRGHSRPTRVMIGVETIAASKTDHLQSTTAAAKCLATFTKNAGR
jgi:hypothetical protein